MRITLMCAVLGCVACAIEYRVPSGVDDTGTTADTDTDTDDATDTDDTSPSDVGDDECEDLCDDEREVCLPGNTCACRADFVLCDGVCVDLETDPAHCGECNRDCGGDPCGAGDCQPAGCGAFPDRCGDSCTDVMSDPLHCSECGRACDGDEMCIEGECDDLD